MTKPKHIPKTLKNILESPVLQAIMDKASNVEEIIEAVDEYWKYDLLNRKPNPAEFDDNGNVIKATNLDLATFLYALKDRGAVINIPKYETKRRKTVKEGQHVISADNRHGKLIGVVSNQNTFSFGVRIIDQNVIGTDSSGFPRTYMLTDFDGSWYDGWRTMQFIPTAEENKFLTESNIVGNNKISFDNFVTPEKWISFFGQYYFTTKCAIDRLKDERKHLKSVKKSMEEAGITLPEDEKEFEQLDSWAAKTTYAEKGHGVKVNCLEVIIDIPENDTTYQEYPMTPEGLLEVRRKIKSINSAVEKFCFATRCIECAVHMQNRFDSFPVWIDNVKWEEGFKETPKSRTLWRRLKIVQPKAFERSVAIRYRIYEKTEYVNEKAAEKELMSV